MFRLAGKLFATHCLECHRVNKEGGRLGPDLSGITSQRSRAALLQSVRQPLALVGRGYGKVSLQLASGETVVGALKAQDAFFDSDYG